LECDRATTGRLTQITFRYRGNNCNQIPDPNQRSYECVDENDGPSNSGPVYIEFTDPKNGEILFRAPNVMLGEAITFPDPPSRFEANTEFQIYTNADRTTLLQEVTFHTSCSQPFFTGQQFGALSVCGYQTENGNIFSCEVQAQFVYTITNIGNIALNLDTLDYEYNVGDGAVSGTVDFENEELAVDGERIERFDVTIDTSTEKIISANGTVTGLTSGTGIECTADDSYTEPVGPPSTQPTPRPPTMAPKGKGTKAPARRKLDTEDLGNNKGPKSIIKKNQKQATWWRI
jgi:hypothetical protein